MDLILGYTIKCSCFKESILKLQFKKFSAAVKFIEKKKKKN